MTAFPICDTYRKVTLIARGRSLIEVKGLNHYYGKFHALRDVSLSVPQGSLVGFIGPNGAGKSTTFKILAGFLVPSSGEVLVGGIDLLREPLKARQAIGYMPETPFLYREMKVEEYLAYVAQLKGLRSPQARQTADEMIERFSVQKFRRTLVGSLSKGNRQRVALAQALIGEPKVLLLDEPTSALDPNSVLDMRASIRELKGKVTVLMSSHILSEISQICDYIVMIRDGQIHFQGKSGEVYHREGSRLEMGVRLAQWKPEWLELLRSLPGCKLEEAEGEKLKFSIYQEDLFFAAFFQLVLDEHLPVRDMLTYSNQLEQFFKKDIQGSHEKNTSHCQ